MNKVSEDISYIGVNDHQIDLFEGQYDVPNGMAYNSYVIIDDKIAIIDSVDINFKDEWLNNVSQVLNGNKPDYLIIQHMEPDHSANIMNFLEERIAKDGVVKPGNVLKVDSFLNHQMDISLMEEIGREFKRRFADKHVTKIMTIEASGIGIACITAQFFSCPVLFAKKTKTKNIAATVYKTQVRSFTHGTEYDVIVSKDFIGQGDKVLIVDDFLAEGNALLGLIDLCRQAGAEVAGCAIAIEKGFQDGRKRVEAKGVRVESLAIVEAMSDDTVTFKK